jgi:hypothetical protein
MVRLRRRDESILKSECGHPEAATFVKRQRCDSPRSCVGIEVALEDRAGPSYASSSCRRVPELTRGPSHTSSRCDGHKTIQLVCFESSPCTRNGSTGFELACLLV